jgi:hypothetical protein
MTDRLVDRVSLRFQSSRERDPPLFSHNRRGLLKAENENEYR